MLRLLYKIPSIIVCFSWELIKSWIYIRRVIFTSRRPLQRLTLDHGYVNSICELGAYRNQLPMNWNFDLKPEECVLQPWVWILYKSVYIFADWKCSAAVELFNNVTFLTRMIKFSYARHWNFSPSYVWMKVYSWWCFGPCISFTSTTKLLKSVQRFTYWDIQWCTFTILRWQAWLKLWNWTILEWNSRIDAQHSIATKFLPLPSHQRNCQVGIWFKALICWKDLTKIEFHLDNLSCGILACARKASVRGLLKKFFFKSV